MNGSYFKAKHVRGKRGRGALEKTLLFGILKRDDKVYTQIVQHRSIKELLPVIRGRSGSGSVIYGDGHEVYDGLVNYDYKKHYGVQVQVQLQKQEFILNFVQEF